MNDKAVFTETTGTADGYGGQTATDKVIETMYGHLTDEEVKEEEGQNVGMVMFSARKRPWTSWLKKLKSMKVRFNDDSDKVYHLREYKIKGRRIIFKCYRNE